MKLGKSLIITGLLFSSVLGSVNVNNITAMAATVRDEESETDTPDSINVKINYEIDDNSITLEEFKGKADPTLPVLSDVRVGSLIDISKIKIPENYETIFEKVPLTKDGNGELAVTVVVRKKVVAVSVRYLDKNNKVISDDDLSKKGLFKNISLKEYNKPVTADNLKDIPSNFEFGGYDSDSKVVTLKEKAPTPAPNPGHPVKPSHKGHSGYALQRVRISFIDQDGDEVGYKQLNGKDTFSSKIEAPAGYTLVNSSDATIKFNKKGNKDIKIKVTKNRPTPVMEKGIVTTNSGLYFHLYTIDGKEITNRGLSGDSKWFTDQYATINGEKMFRVATNEWVKATDVYK